MTTHTIALALSLAQMQDLRDGAVDSKKHAMLTSASAQPSQQK